MIQVFVTEVDGVTERVVSAIDYQDRMIGCVYLTMGKACASIRRLFVAEASRRKGVGAALLAYCENAAIEAGQISLGLVLEVKNTDALKFYEASGYVIGFEYDDGNYAMWKQLSGRKPDATK